MRDSYGKARVLITTLLMLEVCIGVAIVFVTYCYQRILGAYLADMERKILTGQFFNTYVIGLELIITYVASIFMWRRIWQDLCSPNLKLLLSVWTFFCLLIVFCGFGTVWSLYTCADAIETTAEMSLLKGIDLYYMCPERKLLWDGLQYHKECCGVHNYKDWMKASWMPKQSDGMDGDAGDGDGGDADDGEGGGGCGQQCPTTPCSSDEKKAAVLAPYACCKHACGSCYENYMPRSASNPIPTLNLSQINPDGCLPHFHRSMWIAIYLLMALIITAIILDLILCCFTKYIVNKQTQPKQQSTTHGSGCDNMGMTVESTLLFCEPSTSCCEVNKGYTIKQDVVCPLHRGPRLCSCGQPMDDSDCRIIH